MFSILLLDKSGTLHEKNVKSLDRLFMICNYRSEEGFEELHSWNLPSETRFVLYGKRKGKSHYENKCILPQPIHQELFYGNLCILKKTGDEYSPTTLEDWTRFIEKKEDTKPETKELKKEDYESESE
jgi:hypothetical protein